MESINQIVKRLHELGDPDIAKYKQKKFGVISNNSLGIFQKELNTLAKEIGKDSDMGRALFETNIYEARVLCSKIFNPKELAVSDIKKWTPTFENWEICDSFSMAVYAKSPLALSIIDAHKSKENEFEKRTAFATMAAYCMADKKSGNDLFIGFFEYIIAASTDNRLYVKKAVNWALRSIGKRNVDLNKQAILVAESIAQQDDKSAKWIAADAVKELSNPNVRISDYPRSIYRTG